jgi:hypothetical protein
MSEITRTLGDIAKEINREWDLLQTETENAVQRAIRIGRKLTEAKDRCEHGDWLPWLGQNFHGSERQAQVCMRLVKSAESADFESMSQGLKMIAAANAPEPEAATSARDVQRALQASSGLHGELVDADVVEDDLDPVVLRVIDAMTGAQHLFAESLLLNADSGRAERLSAVRSLKAALEAFLRGPA